ncbi:MAG TPA: hypothetical protein PKM28_10360, partial [Tenuifilaceae bacterium]|nr:hypothetical protein [Tenuifilaceae bacterium]
MITLLLSTSDDLLSQNRNIPEYKSDSIGIEKQLDSIEKYINFVSCARVLIQPLQCQYIYCLVIFKIDIFFIVI